MATNNILAVRKFLFDGECICNSRNPICSRIDLAIIDHLRVYELMNVSPTKPMENEVRQMNLAPVVTRQV